MILFLLRPGRQWKRVRAEWADKLAVTGLSQNQHTRDPVLLLPGGIRVAYQKDILFLVGSTVL